MKATKIIIIGGGTMGEAFVAVMRKARFTPASCITVVERHVERCARLIKEYGVKANPENDAAISQADIVVLAVKPQEANELMKQMQPLIQPSALVVSIMAGVPIKRIRTLLKHSRIVRAMPNTPARIQKGMTVWMATPAVSAAQKRLVRAFFSCVGAEKEVRTEDLIDVATAVSGSGPGYIFDFFDTFINAAQTLGLSKKDAEFLVQQTAHGALALWQESGEDPAVLRDAVTSKHGTTEAALKTIKKARVQQVYERALTAAYKRAKELSKE